MSYEKQVWENFPSTNTPVSAERFNHMEDGIASAHAELGGRLSADQLKMFTAEVATPLIARRARLADGVFSAVDGALEDGRCAAIQVQSDSTGNAPDEWVYLLSEWLVDRHPTAHVKYKIWNDAAQAYAAWFDLQGGAAGERHIPFDGTTTRSMFQPVSAIPHIGGDIDIRVRLSMDDWTPAVTGCIVARYGAAGARGWKLNINSGGAIDFTFTTDGTTNIQKVSTATGFADGSTGWVRVTLDVDNGAGGYTWKAYKSIDGVAWTELGSSIVTTGGPVTLFNAAQEYEVGGRGFVGEPWAGKVYEVQIRDGIDGRIVNPQPIDSWVPRAASGAYVPGRFGGSPTLYILNGSHPGAATSYFADSTRHPKMVHPYAGSLMFQSCCHNDGENTGAAYLASRDAWLALSETRAPGSQTVIPTQNPEVPPVPDHMIAQHSRRRALLMTWAARKGLAVVDTYKAFTDNPDGAAALIQADGVHPTVSVGDGNSGMEVWLKAITNAWDAL